MSQQKEVDFEILREPWNKYELDDGTYVKSRYILTKFKRSDKDAQGKISFRIDGQPLTVVYNSTDKGAPGQPAYSLEETQRAIQQELNYKTIEEEWNEYITDDGTKIRIKDTVSKIAKTKLRDINGDPVYYIEHSTLVQAKMPKF